MTPDQLHTIDPEKLIVACTSAEGYKRERFGQEFEETENGNVVISTANATIPEQNYNGFRKPDRIAALKVAQRVPHPENVAPFIQGIVFAELSRKVACNQPELLGEAAYQIAQRILYKRLPLTLLATDAVLTIDHPNMPICNLNQPGKISDEELVNQLTRQLTTQDNPCLKDGLIPAKFTVGMAGVKVSTDDYDNYSYVGQLGMIEKPFYFRPVPLPVIEKYVEEYGQKARKVNGGVMWEHFMQYIEVFDCISESDDRFIQEKNSFQRMTTGVPEEMVKFANALTKGPKNSPGAVRDLSAEINGSVYKYLNISTHQVAWHPWYPSKKQ